jgi:ubiquinol-cytochrome c reductase cytochrome c subunit
MEKKMSMFGVRLGLAALAAGLVLGQGAVLAAGSPDKGKVAYTKYGCYQCHGFVGQGSVATSNGKVIYKTELPLEAFVSFVRTTNRAMPPYSEKVLPNQDLEDIYAYLESLPKPPDYKTIPLLNQ